MGRREGGAGAVRVPRACWSVGAVVAKSMLTTWKERCACSFESGRTLKIPAARPLACLIRMRTCGEVRRWGGEGRGTGQADVGVLGRAAVG